MYYKSKNKAISIFNGIVIYSTLVLFQIQACFIELVAEFFKYFMPCCQLIVGMENYREKLINVACDN